MDPNNPQQIMWLSQLLEITTNIALLTVGYKIIRHMSRMELKVDLMWSRFSRLFDIREDDKKRVGDI